MRWSLSLPLFPVVILLSAALLFMVQPMLARLLLPHFGGGAQVWAACLLFFQSLLLAGYGYAHLLTRFASWRQQGLIHSVLLLLGLCALPWLITPVLAMQTGSPLWGILKVLTLSIGLPYLLLSATGPLLQYWFAARFPLRSAYRLYALSNLGSFAGLLLYPESVLSSARTRSASPSA